MASVICEVVCPCCKVERPATEVRCVDDVQNLWQCKICIMLDKAPCNPGNPFKPKVVKEVAPKILKVKVEPVNANCPGCLKTKAMKDFTLNHVIYSHCNECRDNNIQLESERAKRFLGGGLFTSLSFTLGRCIQCGHTGEISKDFPLDKKSPTGYKHYCTRKCGGKRR